MRSCVVAFLSLAVLVVHVQGGAFADPCATNVDNTGSLMDKLIVGYTATTNLPSDKMNMDYGTWATGANNDPEVPVYPYVEASYYPGAQLGPAPSNWGTKLGNGKPALLYSGVDPMVTDAHMKMMTYHGVHGVTVERFLWTVCSTCDTRIIAHRNAVLANVAKSTVKYGRLFYVFYDLSGSEDHEGTWINELKADYAKNVEQYTKQTNWAKHNGKPVMFMWKGDHKINVVNLQTAINYFKGLGFAVILGVSWTFRNTDADYFNVYATLDGLQPWCMGTSPQDIETNVRQYAFADAEWCTARKLVYQFLVCSGPSINRISPTEIKMINVGTNNLYYYDHLRIVDELRRNFTSGTMGGFVAMFDDYSEAESLAPSAPTLQDLPSGHPWWYTLEQETKVYRSPDFNLRLTFKAVQLMHQGQSLPASIPVSFNSTTTPVQKSC